MKVCIIGASGHVNYVIDAMSLDKDFEIVGISPGSKNESINKILRMLGDNFKGRLYEDYNKMLEELKPDVAVVACHFGDIAKVNMIALEMGCHVFTEKPLATELEDLEKLRRIYEKSQRHLCAMFGIRYKPWFLTAYNLVKSGVIGNIRLINTQKSYKLGKRDDFYKNRATYGGTIPWVGIHAIDWIYWFTNKKFKVVYATHSRKYNKDHGDLEITALCHFTLEDEIFASLSIDYLRPENALTHDDDRMRIVGTEGILEILFNKVYLIDKDYKGQEIPLEEGGNIFLDFLKQIRGQGRCLVSADDSFYVTEIALRARQSADENKVIYLT